MVEYREHLKATLSVAGGFAQATISTGLTALVQNYSASQKYMNALIIHEIIVQAPTGFLQTDTLKFHLSNKSETAVKKSSDVGVILADDFAFGTAVGGIMTKTWRYKIYPNEMVSSTNLYFAVDSGDTGSFEIDIIYTIRKVNREAFINAMLPGQV